MRHLTGLDEIAFTEAFRFDLKDARVPPRTPRLLETDRETAVLIALARRSFTDLVLTFPLVNAAGEWTTTWNLKLSFPVFLRNVLYTLGNVRDARSSHHGPAGLLPIADKARRKRAPKANDRFPATTGRRNHATKHKLQSISANCRYESQCAAG